MENNPDQKIKYITLKDLGNSEDYPYDEYCLKFFIKNDTYGFRKIVKLCGRKVLINLDGFKEWVRKNVPSPVIAMWEILNLEYSEKGDK